MQSLIVELFQIAWNARYLIGGAILLGVLYFAPGWKMKSLGGAIIVSVLGAIPSRSRREVSRLHDGAWA